ncbi:hypothetical protein [Miltoncostaea oceani]|uniref:hypothetical protein n=1 Tax=Miltoncostaea oceani TaxID=2843216 RepID=UPI001C3C9D11|nr:hypothetical protein [Miltoncostaea oceani]
MGQDIHAALQAPGEATLEAGSIRRDHALFDLVMGWGETDEGHAPRGIPSWLSSRMCELILDPGSVDAPDGTEARARLSGVHEPAAGWQSNPDLHSFTWMDPAEAERIHGLWAGGIDYGPTHCRVAGYELVRRTDDPERAAQWLALCGPEVEIPWFEGWMDLPGPRVTSVDELRRLLIADLLPVSEVEGLASLLRRTGRLDLTRHAHRAPSMGDQWQRRGPHPILSPIIDRMRELERRGRRPQLVFWFDN